MPKATEPCRQWQLWAFMVLLHSLFCSCLGSSTDDLSQPIACCLTVPRIIQWQLTSLFLLECLRGSPSSCFSLCQLPLTSTISAGTLFEAMTMFGNRFQGKLVCIRHEFCYKLYLHPTRNLQDRKLLKTVQAQRSQCFIIDLISLLRS